MITWGDDKKKCPVKAPLRKSMFTADQWDEINQLWDWEKQRYVVPVELKLYVTYYGKAARQYGFTSYAKRHGWKIKVAPSWQQPTNFANAAYNELEFVLLERRTFDPNDVFEDYDPEFANDWESLPVMNRPRTKQQIMQLVLEKYS